MAKRKKAYTPLERKPHPRFPTGYSLAELILIVLILAALTAVAVPRMQFAALRRQKADTVARKIATDLRLTRRLAITNAAENVYGYALNMTGGSPYSGYEIVDLETSEVVDSHSIDSEVSCTGGSSFEFGPLGNQTGGIGGTQLTVTSEGKSFTVTVVSATGAVKCTE